MTVRQTILRFIYPLFRRLSRYKNNDSIVRFNHDNAAAVISFYSLHAFPIDKTIFDFNTLKGKKVLLVNLASDCGYTAQYRELEELNRLYKSSLVVLGFPANDFKGQEPGSDQEIEEFCRKNYHVTFPLFTKAPVIEPGQQEIFAWLSNKEKNGWNDEPPSWNFCKYLVDEKGMLQYIFKPSVSPLSDVVLKAIEAPVSFSHLRPAELMKR